MSNALSLLLLLFTFIVSTVSQPEPEGFWSIYCGRSTGSIDKELDISWTGDKEFVQTGESRNGTDGTTLRVFTSKRKMECYTIPVPKGKKILLRMTFNYGNYDGKATPPEMEIIFDGNSGGKLNTTMEGNDVVEIIYLTRRIGTKICLARINPGQDPFVSRIEIRTLEDNMYRSSLDNNRAMRLYRRIAFGAKETIRYPNDLYDRIWSAETLDYSVVKSDITNFTRNMTSRYSEKPPPLLLEYGIEPNMNVVTPNITIPLSSLPSDEARIHDIFYFTEMSNLTGTTNYREFNITLDGGLWWANIVPPYRNVTRRRWIETAVTKESVFTLVPEINSTLPPIISGMEIYTLTDANDRTKEDDVKSLSILQEHFQILQEWT